MIPEEGNKLVVLKDAVDWYNEGIDLHRSGNYKEAIQCYDRALKIDPKGAGVWNNKGVAFKNLGHYDEAVQCYDRALKIDPKYARAWLNKSVALGNLGCYDEAIQCYDRALEIDPKDADAWYSKGVALGNLSRYDEAVQCYDQALEIDPEVANAKNNRDIALRKRGALAKDTSKETLREPVDIKDISGLPHPGEIGKSPQPPTYSAERVKTQSQVTIERTIYDPLIQGFTISSSRPLVNVRDWINRHDPSSYWLVI